MDIETSLKALYAAMLAHDIPALDRLLAEDVVYVHSTGVAETKTDFLTGVRDGLYEYERVRPTQQTILRDTDVAMVYDVLDFQGGPRGVAHAPVQLITTLVWVKSGAGWRLRLRQATRIP